MTSFLVTSVLTEPSSADSYHETIHIPATTFQPIGVSNDHEGVAVLFGTGTGSTDDTVDVPVTLVQPFLENGPDVTNMKLLGVVRFLSGAVRGVFVW